MNNLFFKKAFTLAEVLITLGIIGVVAALTIPTLIQKQNETATVSAVKKAYSALSSAYTLAVQEKGTPDDWSLSADGTGALNILKALAPYLSITKNCGTDTGCFPTTSYSFLNKTPIGSPDGDTTTARAQLNDGTLLSIGSNAGCTGINGDTPALHNVCGRIYVDINGFKSPNQLGIDYFQFRVTQYGIIPAGTQLEKRAGGYVGFGFADSCKDKSTAEGYSCAAWVIYNENMDYLHCDNLDWAGPIKCQ